ncbi:MAG: endonuclease/exonuclease/phosphatase family protein [Actinomycetota bacterium]
MRLRVVVYNVRGFRDGLDLVWRVVAHFQPDVVLLNESGSRLKLRRFAKRLDMEVAADPWSPFRRRVKNAVLVGPPWRIVTSRLHRFRDVRRKMYPRGALIAQIGGAGHRMWAISVHLGLHPSERLHAVQELSDLVRGLSGSVLIGGDFNETPDRKAARFLAERFWDAWQLGGQVAGDTFPSADPTARIDYLYVSEGIGVDDIIVPPGRDVRLASDHLPVVAQLRLPGSEP